MIQKSASELKSVDFQRQFISGCLYEQPGRHPLSGNMYLNMKNHECQNDSDSGKYIPGNLNVLADSLSREISYFKPKGLVRLSIKLDIAAINQWLMCLQDESQASYVGLLSGSGNRHGQTCVLPRVLVLQVM